MMSSRRSLVRLGAFAVLFTGSAGLRAAAAGPWGEEGLPPGACAEGTPTVSGRLDIDGAGGIALDKLDLEVHLEHKLDVDAAEDRCIAAVELRGQLDPRGCRVALRFEADPAHELLQLQAAQIEADSFCPGWADAREGTYTLIPGRERAEAALSVAAVSPRTASAACVQDITVELRSTFALSAEEAGGEPKTARLSGVSLVGPLSSKGETAARCPKPPAPPPAPRPEEPPPSFAVAPVLLIGGGVQLRDERDTGDRLDSELNPKDIGLKANAPLALVRLRVEEKYGKSPLWLEAEYRFAAWSVLYNGKQSDLNSSEVAARAGVWLVGAADPAGNRLGIRGGPAVLSLTELEGDGFSGDVPGFALVPQVTGHVGAELQLGGERLRGALLSDFGLGGTMWYSASEARLGLQLGERAQLSLLGGFDLRRAEYQLDFGGFSPADRSLQVMATNAGLAFTVR